MKMNWAKAVVLSAVTGSVIALFSVNIAQASVLQLGYSSSTAGGSSVTSLTSCTTLTCTAGYTLAGGNITGSLTTSGNFTVIPFGTTNVNIQSLTTSSNTVYLWATLTGLSSSTFTYPSVLSGLTSNTLPSGWTAALYTFYDSTGTAFGTGTQLAEKTFTAHGSYVSVNPFTPTGNYSLTELFVLTSNSISSALSTITMTDVPEPSELGMMGLGLMLIGLMGLKIRQKKYR